MAAEPHPTGSRFIGRSADGWFWYEVLRQPPEAAPPLPSDPAPAAPSSATAEGPAPLSAAWFRENFQSYADRAVDDPTPANVRAWAYLNKVMTDRSARFADVAQRVTIGDPFLDATTERPLAPFAANAVTLEATRAQHQVLSELARTAGLLFFFDGSCAACARQVDVLHAMGRQHGFETFAVSLDGAPPPGIALAAYRTDAGQARRLGVVGLPALFLMRPPDAILPLAQGALDMVTLSERVVAQAHQAGWLSEEAYLATRPARQPYPSIGPDDLPRDVLDDPVALVAAMQARLTPKTAAGDDDAR